MEGREKWGGWRNYTGQLCSDSLFTERIIHIWEPNTVVWLCLVLKDLPTQIHGISQAQFKSRFVDDYKKMEGYAGIGAIDDESPQPLIFRSKFGVYAVVATGLITNKNKLVGELLNEGASFTEMAGGGVNNAEIVAS